MNSSSANVASIFQTGGSPHIQPGGGVNAVSLIAQVIEIRGSVTVAMDDHASGVSTFASSASSAHISGAVKLSFGDGNGSASFATGGLLRIDGGVQYTGGNGADNLAINGGDLHLGAVSLVGGLGNSIFSITAAVFRGPVSILMGAGADILNIGANTATGHAEFKSTASFDGGAGGNDTAHVSAALFANVYPAGQPSLPNFETKD